MSNPYRDCLVELYAWAKRTSSPYYRTADVLDRTRILLAQPELPDLTDEELLRIYGKAKRDHCYEGDADDWLKKSERAYTVAGLRAAIAADRARRIP
jgi:hypothetical protein